MGQGANGALSGCSEEGGYFDAGENVGLCGGRATLTALNVFLGRESRKG